MNKKIWKKVLAIGLCMMLGSLSLAGCGNKDNKKSGNTATDIEISYWNSGLGTAWLDAVIEAFEKAHPEYKVNYTANANSAAVTAAYGLVDTDTVDLYMNIKEYDTSYMETLNDVLDSTVEGESKSIGEKILPEYLRLEQAEDGNYYHLTYGGGILGIVYNKTMFTEAGIQTLPRTTDELSSVCDTLTANNMTPFCHFKTVGYWDFINEVFFAQYDGLDYYINTFYKEAKKETFLKEDGRYEAIKACEKFITPDYVLTGSNSNDHVTMQTEFLNKKAAMMVSGSWLSNEMSSIGSTEDFAMMKTPVISSITDKLSTITKESELRKVITAVDAVTDGTKNIDEYQEEDNYNIDGMLVSASDWEYVRKARNTVSANYSGESMFIPSYSNAKEGAKEFVKFLYSDEGYRVYADALHVGLPIMLDEGQLDMSEWNSFEKNQISLFEQAEQFASYDIMGKNKLFYAGGARAFADYPFVNKFCSANVAERQSAEEAWNSIVDRISSDYENNWLANIK